MSVFPKKHHGPELMCGGPQMCRDCEERIIEASNIMLADLGTPDCYYCGLCGKKCATKEEFLNHFSNALNFSGCLDDNS